ncbi:aldo/keto reductase [Pelagimonas varians]|uniref:L-glyceraldehyde 3-phosphate reductase n=1 Tax=Pelagimonas varians TaxID=696760 RepID=A0A238KQG7_9RHOB|nr:aldo/keto reductase [Pelagimonas varians]PYG28524.1 aryl-alcohol dehydrogenase-like predicted oxidoreductase [Pelagimonas varians]SMX45035.1 L-glyceraldehyde 3-phosphate reductase [Pelagimonas varians]
MTQLTTLSGDSPARFAFGTMQFGGRADETASQALFDACREAGIRHFDTAHAYTEGASETLLGNFAANEREKLFIATKAGYAGGSSRENILTTFDQSRSRLGMDVVDLLYLHRFDDDTPLEESFETLAELQSAGKIRFIGVSNFAAWQVMKAQSVAATFGTRIDVIQPMYNLVKRQVEVEILPMCASEGILPVPYSPLGGGLLTGKYSGGRGGRLTEDERYGARYGQKQMHDTAQALVDLGAEVGTDPATLAVAWVAHHSVRPVPILSARSATQLRPSLEGMRFPMDDALYARLSALSATPPPATDRLEEA